MLKINEGSESKFMSLLLGSMMAMIPNMKVEMNTSGIGKVDYQKYMD